METENIKLDFQGRLYIVELPFDSKNTSLCSLNREQQINFKNEITKSIIENIKEENGGVLIVPPNTKITVLNI